MSRQIKADLVVKDKATKTIKKVETQTTNSFNKMKSSANGLATVWKKALPLVAFTGASVAIYKIAGAISELAAEGDRLDKLTTNLNISKQAIQELEYAAGQSGLSVEGFDKALQTMSRRIAFATRDTGAANAAFKSLGVNVEKLNKLSADQQLKFIADRMNEVANESDRAAYNFEIFGNSGFRMNAMLKDGSEGLDKYAKKAQELGHILSEKEIENAMNYTDAMDDLNKAFKGMVIGLTPLIPLITGFVAVLKDTVEYLNRFETVKDSLEYWGQYGKTLLSENEKIAKSLRDKIKHSNEQIAIWTEQGNKSLVDKYKNTLLKQEAAYKDHLLKMKGLSKSKAKTSGKTTGKIDKVEDTTEADFKAIKDKLLKRKQLEEDLQIQLLEIKGNSQQAEIEAENLRYERFKETNGFIQEAYEIHKQKLTDINNKYTDIDIELKQKEIDRFAAMSEEATAKRIAADEAAFEKEKEIVEVYSGILESNMGDAFASMVEGSKNAGEAFTDMATGIISDLTRMIIKMMIYKTIASAVGYNVGRFSGWGAAEGGVAKGGFTPFASGGVVTKPTAGLVGEGMYNEAIVPLPNGKAIPVDMKGQTGTTIVNNINVESSGGDAVNDRRQANIISQAIDMKIKQSLIKEQRPGGLIYGGR